MAAPTKNKSRPVPTSRLPRDFYARPTVAVAKDLLGKIMVFNGIAATITETEAYVGKNDEACHASRGKTKRTEIMFGPPGHSYVYFIYGMYHCLNFVTEPEGTAAAVLIRGCQLLDDSKLHLNGPGKLCRHFGITRDYNAIDLCSDPDFYVLDHPIRPKFDTTPRIGISKAKDKLWRYVVKSNS
ncbi:MAG: DNA-3-methyladenine glycosylase [Alphaproteobacteria bacterium]|nr:MAG: DNA-3-methyladenine glycosylase [Alphaproteobacteria bacterium]